MVRFIHRLATTVIAVGALAPMLSANAQLRSSQTSFCDVEQRGSERSDRVPTPTER